MGRRALQWRLFGSRRRFPADERGVALIEFALVLPLILILLFGMIDVGKAFNYWNDETNLAGDGARYATVDNSPTKNPDGTPTAGSLNSAIKNQADSNELRSGGTSSISSPGVNVCIWFPNPVGHSATALTNHGVNDPVQVVVTAQYNWLAYLVGQGMPLHSSLTATSTMKLEQPYKGNGTDAFTTGTANNTDGSGTC